MTGYPMVFCLALESVNHLWELVSGSYYPMPRDGPKTREETDIGLEIKRLHH